MLHKKKKKQREEKKKGKKRETVLKLGEGGKKRTREGPSEPSFRGEVRRPQKKRKKASQYLAFRGEVQLHDSSHALKKRSSEILKKTFIDRGEARSSACKREASRKKDRRKGHQLRSRGGKRGSKLIGERRHNKIRRKKKKRHGILHKMGEGKKISNQRGKGEKVATDLLCNNDCRGNQPMSE